MATIPHQHRSTPVFRNGRRRDADPIARRVYALDKKQLRGASDATQAITYGFALRARITTSLRVQCSRVGVYDALGEETIIRALAISV